MSEKIFEEKYRRLVSLVHKMREKQFASKYGVKSDIADARALEKKVDVIVKEERKRLDSGQTMLL